MPEQRVCKICGEPFLPYRGSKYCSFLCRNISDKRRNTISRKKWLGKHPGKSSGLRLRFDILSRDNFTCQYCGRKAPNVILHIDHIQPSSKGGTDNKNNLITACQECNFGKSDVLLKTHKL